MLLPLINKVKVAYYNSFQILKGLPRHCSASGMFTENHVCNFDARIRKGQISLYNHIKCSDNNFLLHIINSDRLYRFDMVKNICLS